MAMASLHNQLLHILPEVDLDSLFTEADEMESKHGESTETDNTPPLDPEAALKRRKRIQSIVFSEKIRRKRMRECFATLTTILPAPPTNKVPRYCLIAETIKYIEQLHERVGELKQKKEQLLAKKNKCLMNLAPPQPSTDVNVGVEIFGNEVIIIITSSEMPSCVSKIYQCIEAQNLDIQTADFYADNCIVFLYFRATCCAGVSTQLRQCLQTDLPNAYR
ncbi:hypothetical protein SUGI_0336080 [Cryptomeria japonica]|nr:hypothetical protein SUGI_0336080 [Cryptomeria japonica]